MKQWNRPELIDLNVQETKAGGDKFETPDKNFIGPDGYAYTSYAS